MPPLVVGLRQEGDEGRLLLVEAEGLLSRRGLFSIRDVDRQRASKPQQQSWHLLVAERPVVEAALKVLEKLRMKGMNLINVSEDGVHHLEGEGLPGLFVVPAILLQWVEVFLVFWSANVTARAPPKEGGTR